MIFSRKRVATRFAATAVATGLLAAGAVATAGQAVADGNVNPRDGGATATLEGLKVSDKVDVEINGSTRTYGAGLFHLNAEDGGTLRTYCIDFGTAAVNGVLYKETGWASSSLHGNPDAGKIHWILQNSFPMVNDLNALAAEAGAGSLSEDQAAAGTQAAIWSFSDGVAAVPHNDDAKKLAEWLTESATDVEEPKASLELDPNQVSGKPGNSLGPVTVHTSADSAVVSQDDGAAGVSLIDGDGELITDETPVSSGTEVYFDVPEGTEDGSASLTASVTAEVPVGRAFTGVDTKTQTMILAGSSASSVTAGATASWATEGAAPTVEATESCVAGGVEIAVGNSGDEAFRFGIEGETYEVQPGENQAVTVPVGNKDSYEILVEGLDSDDQWTFTGVLDCETGDPGGKEEIDEGNDPEPASTGGGDADVDEDPNLAETGSSGNNGMIIGIAVALLVAGGGAVFFIRKKSATAGE